MGESASVSLSQLLVAYLIEFDNAAETWLPHATTVFGDGGPPPPVPRKGVEFRRPWLASVTVWQNLLRFLADDEGLPVAVAATAPADLMGLRRWGYVRLEGDRVVLRWAGRLAHRIWSELEPAIERRWQGRFGADHLAELRAALEPFALAVTSATPRSMPQLSLMDGGRSRPPAELGHGAPVPAAELALGTLLARALLRFTVVYEQDSEISAAAGFGVLDPLAAAGGELPRTELLARSGVGAETATAFLGWLRRRDFVTESRVARRVGIALTARGSAAVAEHLDRSAAAEDAVLREAGAQASVRLLAAIAVVRDQVDGLRQALEPPEGAWRSRPPYAAGTAALLADPLGRLPRFPVVTHRGGFPDGA